MVKTVVGSFDSAFDAVRASELLLANGFLRNDINVVASNVVRPVAGSSESTGATDEASSATSGALAGGALGGAAGLAAGLLGLAIPGIGPILAAGPIAAALAGAGAGAVAGGLIGGLTEQGVSEVHAEYYTEAVRRGGALVTVKVDESRTDEALRILRNAGAFDIEDRAVRWRSEGWTGYNPNAEPFSFEEIDENRTRYRAGP